MSLKTGLFVVCALAASAGNAYAASSCEIPTNKIDLVTSPIMVNSQQGPGAVLMSRTWPLHINEDQVSCVLPQQLMSRWTTSSLKSIGNNIWQTSVPGIGVRFTLETSTGQKLTVPNDAFVAPAHMKGARMKLEVIKTSDRTGSGALKSGEYANFAFAGHPRPAIRLNVPANGIKIIASSCEIQGHNERRVTLPSIMARALKGPGTWAGETPFAINLVCHGGVSPRGESELRVNWFGRSAEGTNATDGVLFNSLRGGNAAQGVGVQVLDWHKQPIKLNATQTIGTVPSQYKVIPLRMTARYYQYGARINPGAIYSTLTFTLSYH
ncbi:type 1 fimbrial protein [Shimwellia pseudoproteus]|uniref:fimbrial protein n=1 Tax=Shimwellia pseudoproteus TaxID=570012 RepID=UPI0018EAC2CE|nr:fimbrial protein [Shimwellia pseudoproteus]MBJ3813848.1 type 1 fimbrial protein [Shimwellia pseudoproteus]